MAYFEVGDTVRMGKSASIPSAEVQRVFKQDGEEMYELEWSNGNTNTKLASEIDKKAVNTTPKF